MERLLAAVLLAIALAGIALFLRGDRAEWRSFRTLTDTAARQTRYRRWTVRLWLFFGLPALLGLAMLHRLDALTVVPSALTPVASRLPRLSAPSSDLLQGLAAGALIGVAATAVLIRIRRGRMPPQVGDVAAMLPRNRAELRLGTVLSISAGLTEEVAFRLFLPLVIAIVSGSALAGVVIATALFGAMHLYQGWAGVAASTLVGAVLMFCYLASGALWIAILLHALTDLSALVLRPALAGAWRR